jgi:hypothetical protein
MMKNKNPFKAKDPNMQPLFDKWKEARDALYDYENKQRRDPIY